MASRNQEHRRYLAANCQRHPPARTHIRPETVTDRGTPCHALVGMRAPMGLKIYGPDLETIEQSGKAIEQALKDVPSVVPSSVFYDRAVGAPYLEIKLNRDNMARYGVNVEDLQEILSAAVGGMILTKTVEGRERFPVRLRYAANCVIIRKHCPCSWFRQPPAPDPIERTRRYRICPRRPD